MAARHDTTLVTNCTPEELAAATASLIDTIRREETRVSGMVPPTGPVRITRRTAAGAARLTGDAQRLWLWSQVGHMHSHTRGDDDGR